MNGSDACAFKITFVTKVSQGIPSSCLLARVNVGIEDNMVLSTELIM